MKIIAITGYAGVGKDTLAKGIAQVGEDHVVSIEIRSIAAPLKDSLAAKLGIPREDLDHPERKKAHRVAMQRRGDEERAKHGEDYYLDQLAEEIVEAENEGFDAVVVPDVRKPREIKFLRRIAENRLAQISECHVVNLRRPGVGPANGHSTEQHIPDELIDQIAINDGSKKYLREVVAREVLTAAGLI